MVTTATITVQIEEPEEYDILRIPLFSSRKFWLTSDPWVSIWDLIKRISNLDLTNALQARLYGSVRFDPDPTTLGQKIYGQHGVAPLVNGEELDSVLSTETPYNFDFPDILAWLYQGYNELGFRMFKATVTGGCTYYLTMTLDIYYPLGQKPSPPEVEEPEEAPDWWQIIQMLLENLPLIIIVFGGIYLLSWLPRPRRRE